MQINKEEIREVLRDRLKGYIGSVGFKKDGVVATVSDGIAVISGLQEAGYGEIVLVGDTKVPALVMNLERDTVGAVVLEDDSYSVAAGDRVITTGEELSVPVGRGFLGRVVDPLGKPIDGLGEIIGERVVPAERDAPSVMDRYPVNSPLMTGYKAIDAMVPIGKGQRELIIGDRQTGKTTLAIDIIINQAPKGTKCIYVAIGQKASSVVEVVEKLKAKGAMDMTTVVVANAGQSAALQYIAPYTATSMAEYFRDAGEDAIIIYDDLSKHAVAYRQLSLLLRRPPGREAYPGDVFYLHSRLLERSASVNIEFLNKVSPGGTTTAGKEFGSLTAFPIIETQGGDFSGFVSTNVVSITDGQIFLDVGRFNANMRPAVDPGISVSRIGGAAQYPFLKMLSGRIRTDLAQYNELQAFSQFASDLEDSTRDKLLLGAKISRLMVQSANSPLSAAEQSVLLIAVTHPVFHQITEQAIESFEKSLLNFMRLHYKDLMHDIEKGSDGDGMKLTLGRVNLALNEFQKVMS